MRDWVITVLSVSLVGVCALKLPPNIKCREASWGGNLWAESVDNQEEDTGSQNLVLRLTRDTETALTGKRS